MKAEPKVARRRRLGLPFGETTDPSSAPRSVRVWRQSEDLMKKRHKARPKFGLTSTLAAPTMKKRGHPTSHELRAMLRLSLQETTPNLHVAVSIDETTTTTTKPREEERQVRVCQDFRDLNRACPKDNFPLPITEMVVDSTTGHGALSFMDGSSGYNQIMMDPDDAIDTAFRTPKGNFYYIVMPFGLKNASATYRGP
ncbi:hypothetical protein QYE76_008221 [Lolium multiflorum]|uniref:Reverse transcriptase domain-containing protein n=1 Tax=Lolium multiflorum TaxID=4521 RepID=A0AAD8Q140_LOLMU|nr:hypothetical protein QYE76_008221 [Lolium multiflorum]